MMKCLLLLLLALPCMPTLLARDTHVDDVDAFNQALASAQPGDNLVLREGEWRDAKLVFRARGTMTAPITLRASNPGKTILTGRSTLRIGGEYLVVMGLVFQDPDPSVSDLITFRIDSDELAHHCRLTDCAVIGTKPLQEPRESRWLGLYGSHHRVDHCTLQGKSDKGSTVVVWLSDVNEGQHQIDHNYFGPREKLGKNGGETIRVGDSKTSMLTAGCTIERNLFEKCNGETECISNKSCGNIYRENTFLEVSGTLTLRHGNRCLVERNLFLGNDARGTGGIRIIGEDHTIRGNYLENLTGDDARSAISFMMGIPNSPLHRYFQVKRAIVENNSIVNCEHPLLIGLSDDEDATLAPVDTMIRGNVILSPGHPIVEARCSLDGIRWSDNHFVGKSLGIRPLVGIDAVSTEPTRLESVDLTEVGPCW